ncbi:MAG TPA: hypothetical protein VH164_01985 [Ktedonobacteraceae bacterium]|nr:hypothetical protein [Ktedonobacteraceae bacterium]
MLVEQYGTATAALPSLARLIAAAHSTLARPPALPSHLPVFLPSFLSIYLPVCRLSRFSFMSSLTARLPTLLPVFQLSHPILLVFQLSRLLVSLFSHPLACPFTARYYA